MELIGKDVHMHVPSPSFCSQKVEFCGGLSVCAGAKSTQTTGVLETLGWLLSDPAISNRFSGFWLAAKLDLLEVLFS
jgi:hypothetical protein